MYLNRIQYNGTAYVDADQDMIMNREGDGNKIVSIVSSSSDSKETRFEISLPENVGEKAPRLLTPRETILEQDRTLTLEDKGGNGKYYVYVKVMWFIPQIRWQVRSQRQMKRWES